MFRRTARTLLTRRYAVALSGGAAVLALAPEDQLETVQRISNSLTTATTTSLIRSYLVYSACSIPMLIDYAPGLLSAFTHSPIPGVGALTEIIVRHTFFAQFVPGETVAECMPSMWDLRRRNVGTVLNYSAEADEEAHGRSIALEKQRLDEVYRAIDALGDFESQAGKRGASAFAMKIIGLIDPDILARASTTLLRLRETTYSNAPSSPKSSPHVVYPGTPSLADAQVVARPGPANNLLALTGAVDSMGVLATDQGLAPGDLEELNELWTKLRRVAAHARDRGVKLLIDAEHTWYQPSLDAYTTLLSQEFNRDTPLIYGTYQCYLNRQPSFLAAAMKHADDNGYRLGVKLVRGAYFVQERKKWLAEGRPGPDPIWQDKPGTDKAYNDSVSLVISTLAHQLDTGKPSLSVFFGTHNEASCDLVVDTLRKHGLANKRLRPDVEGKVFIAQLYGMKDDLTDRMAAAFESTGLPFASKYIAYGKLSEVMPFLGRRAIENKSVMSGEGGAAAERKRLSAELWRRVFG